MTTIATKPCTNPAVVPSRIYRRYDRLLREVEVWSHANVYGLKKCFGLARTNLSSQEKEELRERTDYQGNQDLCKRLDEEYVQTGIAWLQSKAFRKDGTPRQDQVFGIEFDDRSRRVLNSFTHFEFVGYLFYQKSWYFPDEFRAQPVYRCHGETGWFDYYHYRNWGGENEFQILGRRTLLQAEIPTRRTVTVTASPPCSGCIHYHGHFYNSVQLVCGMHPYGPEADFCNDKKTWN